MAALGPGGSLGFGPTRSLFSSMGALLVVKGPGAAAAGGRARPVARMRSRADEPSVVSWLDGLEGRHWLALWQAADCRLKPLCLLVA